LKEKIEKEEEKKLIDKFSKPYHYLTHLDSYSLKDNIISERKEIPISQETKSEHDKEDNYRLEHDLDEETKSIHVEGQSDKFQGSLSTKGESKLEQIRTRYDSDTGSICHLASQEGKNQCTDYHKIYEGECDLISSPKSQSDHCISHSSEVVSLISEIKFGQKENNVLTNPTSESSSIN
jgi:hypothetical protein